MRTTVTLDPDVAEMISRLMSERGISFKQALNETVRRALAPPPSPYTTPTFPLGTPGMNLDWALAVAAAEPAHAHRGRGGRARLAEPAVRRHRPRSSAA